MNLKRWFAWLCLALMLVAEIFLFHAVREKDSALVELQAAQARVWQVQKEMDELKNSNTGLQAAELARLRKQNEIYAGRIASAEAMITNMEARVKQVTQQLATARTALKLQQEHLNQLETEKQLVTETSGRIIHRNACINNLRQIDGAKQQWALEKNKPGDAEPTAKDLLPYFKDGIFPACPDGGTYSINQVDALPTCTLPEHVLPP